MLIGEKQQPEDPSNFHYDNTDCFGSKVQKGIKLSRQTQ